MSTFAYILLAFPIYLATKKSGNNLVAYIRLATQAAPASSQ